MSRPWIVVDWETLSQCDLTKAGSDRYAQDLTTEVLCLCFEAHTRQRGSWVQGQPCPPLILQAVRDGWTFVAHQAGFERSIWRWQMEPDGWPPVPLEQWADTMARAQQLVLPAGLDRVLQVLKLPVSKDMEGNALIKKLNREYAKTGVRPAVSAELLERIVRYCFVDIDGQVALHRRIGWLPAHERPIWEASTRVNDRGVRLDLELVSAMQDIVDQATGPLALRFRELTGGLNFGQIQKVRAWVADRGVNLPNLAKDTLAELLGEQDEGDDGEAPAYEEPSGDVDEVGDAEVVQHVVLPDDVREALHIRQLVGSASVKKLGRMRTCVGYDGRARGLLVYHGTGPGRQAGRLLQPHNFPRGTIKEDGEAPDPETLVRLLKQRDAGLIEDIYGPAVEVVVSSLRYALIADPDAEYLSGDYSGIQARTVLAVAGQHEKTAIMAAGLDIYCDMASQIYKRHIDKKKDYEERQVGKNSVLGLGFQMGPPKFFLKYGKGQTLDFCKEVVRVYRKEWAPLVPELWYALQEAAVKAVWDGTPQETHGITYFLEDQWLVARFPNDSTLHYFNPQKTRRAMPWDETDVRRGFSYQVMKAGQWVTRDAFGGQLTENAVMKIEREIVEHGKKLLEANGFPVVLEVHDEALTEPRKGADIVAFKQILEDVEPWVKAYQIPIHVDVWRGPRYRK